MSITRRPTRLPPPLLLCAFLSQGALADPPPGPLDWVRPATGCPSLMTATECLRLMPTLDTLPDTDAKMAYLRHQGIDLAYRLSMCDCKRTGPKASLGPLANLQIRP